MIFLCLVAPLSRAAALRVSRPAPIHLHSVKAPGHLNSVPWRRRLIFSALLVASLAPCRAANNWRIVHVYPHDSSAFTQGLVYTDGHLYESTGINGHSTLRLDDLETGRVLQSAPLDEKYFAEGLTEWGNTLIQLTWLDHIAFVYDRSTFHLLRTLHYDGEGWGLTHDGKTIILSDGTPTLRFLDPVTFNELRRITVKDHGQPVPNLNELEFVHGQIFANIWFADRIARIDPATGKVLGWIDLAGLLPSADRSSEGAVLNGIAWDQARNRLFVTGKLWPKLFEIEILPESANPAPHPSAP